MPIEPASHPYDRPSDAELFNLFDNPGTVAPGTFELGLTLGGTVSAGAYTAGVLDFLVEALDSWTALRDQGAEVPDHKTIIRFLAGTSGGGVCSAIFARAMNYIFPPVSQATPPDTAAQNPFYDIWVNRLDLKAMLTTGDLDAPGATITSLLNSQPLDALATAVVNYTATPLLPPRPWLANPLRLFLTLTNLNGMPYSLEFGSMKLPNGNSANLQQDYVAHADYARFAFIYPGGTLGPAGGPGAARPDEFVLGFDTARQPNPLAWSDFGQYALGTAAYPIGFTPRRLTRPITQYKYRLNDEPAPVPPAAPGQPPHYYPLIPDWAAIQLWNAPAGGGIPDAVTFSYVDGGVCDNEPIELVRTALAGISGTNPRDGLDSNRAVLLIDPFAGNTAMIAPLPRDVLSSVTALISTFTQQIRYDTRDVMLAANPDIFSRFMISAQRGNKVGDDALATAPLGAFIGFACSDFRRHDYLLGRQNCQNYLRSFLVLPKANPLFATWRDKPFASAYEVTDETNAVFLPIIPLTGDTLVTEPLPTWPVGAFDPQSLAPDIEHRLQRLLSDEFAKGPLTDVLTWLAGKIADAPAADYVIGLMQQALAKAGLARP
jgi:hypothetical protein